MRWSKRKSRLFELLLPAVHRRLDVFITSYSERDPSIGRGWVTIDGSEVYSTAEKQIVYDAVAQYPDLPIAELCASENPVVRALLLVDRRTGKARAAALDPAPGGEALFARCRQLRLEIAEP